MSEQKFINWAEDRIFAELFFYLSKNHLVGMSPERAFSLWKIAQTLENVPGCIVELGVYRGGSAFLLGKVLPNKTLHLFDSFEGLPEPSSIDRHKKGDFSEASIEKTKQLLNFTDASFHIGHFPETFDSFSSPIALAHLDADLYESTKNGLEFFWPMISLGGCIVGDDYGWHHCPGVKEAFDEFTTKHKFTLEFPVQYQCVVRKK